MKIGNFSNCDEIIRFLNLPKIIVNQNSSINYLNFQKYYYNGYQIKTLKYYFHRNSLVIILFNYIELPIRFIFEMIEFTINQIIIFISENPTNIIKDLKDFHKNLFTNVIYIDLENFENTQKFTSFQRFPQFHSFSSSTFIKEDFSNLKGHKFRILCETNFLFSRCRQNGRKNFGYGRYFNLVYEFGKFINATNVIYTDVYKKDTEIEMRTNLKGLMNKQIVELYPSFTEFISYPIEKNFIHIAIPRSKLINTKYYIINPFSAGILLLCLSYILYASIIITLTLSFIKRKGLFWKIFNQI